MEKANDARDGAWLKKMRLQKLLNMIDGNPQKNEDQILARYMIETGLSKVRAKEYADELTGAGLTVRDNGRIIAKVDGGG